MVDQERKEDIDKKPADDDVTLILTVKAQRELAQGLKAKQWWHTFWKKLGVVGVTLTAMFTLAASARAALSGVWDFFTKSG